MCTLMNILMYEGPTERPSRCRSLSWSPERMVFVFVLNMCCLVRHDRLLTVSSTLFSENVLKEHGKTCGESESIKEGQRDLMTSRTVGLIKVC